MLEYCHTSLSGRSRNADYLRCNLWREQVTHSSPPHGPHNPPSWTCDLETGTWLLADSGYDVGSTSPPKRTKNADKAMAKRGLSLGYGTETQKAKDTPFCLPVKPGRRVRFPFGMLCDGHVGVRWTTMDRAGRVQTCRGHILIFIEWVQGGTGEFQTRRQPNTRAEDGPPL